MLTRISRRHVTRAAALLSLTVFLAACGSASTTAPDSSRAVRPPQAARHDDVPPDTPCRSGWQTSEGKWVCNDA